MTMAHWYSNLTNCVFLAILLLILPCRLGIAQSLTEKLLAADPTQLAEDARARGNIVRGAILFHQGNINCAKCHRPTSEQERLGPDLSRMDATATDAYLIESILKPSQVIKKGFETTVIASSDGRVFNGIILEQNAQRIVLRESKNLDQPITLARDEIDEIRPGTLSSMPEKLADELKDRQQFLDLLCYVIDIKERGPESLVNPARTERRELAPELLGVSLIQQMNCIACHGAGELEKSLLTIVPAKQAPRLKWSAAKLSPRWLEKFIANPQAVKPGTSMPHVLLGDDAKRSLAGQAITHFLLEEANNQFVDQEIDLTAVSRGFDLFHSVGCVACHSPRDEFAGERPLVNSQALGELVEKYNIDGLVDFLENPLQVRPSGHMPNMRLTHREATDLANFLLQKKQVATTNWSFDPDLAKQGRLLFHENRCQNCHTDFEAKSTQSVRSIELGNLNLKHGCLSETAGDWPQFQFQQTERQAIQAALQRLTAKSEVWALTREQQLDVNLQSFNCLACHDRNQMGGVPPERNPHFKTTNMNLGEQGRIPPTLTGVGAKLKEKWMREVLVTGRTIRPYMKTRMPQYGEENIGHLIELFQLLDHMPETQFAEFDDQEQMRKQGLELAGTKGLNCVSCHTFQYQLSDTMPAVDLTEMAERLEKDWFYRYMLAPQTYSPHTVMPSFWPAGKAVRKDIAGTPNDQIEAIWQYLLDGRQAAAPHGVVREPLEIVVEQEAQMLRRSYPGIGKRGIGVGYPGGVNMMWDAEQLRLHAVWKGKFVDPGGVWSGQGAGNVRPMGPTIEFTSGPELDDQLRPWIVSEDRPIHHQFRGYELDALRRPKFRYTFESVAVEDYFVEFVDATINAIQFKRSLTFTAPQERKGLRFRIAAGAKISSTEQQCFTVDDRLTIHIASAHSPILVDAGDIGARLEIQFDLAAGETEELVLEYRWE